MALYTGNFSACMIFQFADKVHAVHRRGGGEIEAPQGLLDNTTAQLDGRVLYPDFYFHFLDTWPSLPAGAGKSGGRKVF